MSSPNDAITADAVDKTAQQHNQSAQVGVEKNPDPVLDIANEHHHAHLHHGTTALPDAKDDLVYANTAAAPDYKERPMSSSADEESGRMGDVRSQEEDGKTGWRRWTAKRIYRKFKPVFHLAFWGVWTA